MKHTVKFWKALIRSGSILKSNEKRMDPECVFDEKYMEEMKAKFGKGIKKFCVLW